MDKFKQRNPQEKEDLKTIPGYNQLFEIAGKRVDFMTPVECKEIIAILGNVQKRKYEIVKGKFNEAKEELKHFTQEGNAEAIGDFETMIPSYVTQFNDIISECFDDEFKKEILISMQEVLDLCSPYAFKDLVSKYLGYINDDIYAEEIDLNAPDPQRTKYIKYLLVKKLSQRSIGDNSTQKEIVKALTN